MHALTSGITGTFGFCVIRWSEASGWLATFSWMSSVTNLYEGVSLIFGTLWKPGPATLLLRWDLTQLHSLEQISYNVGTVKPQSKTGEEISLNATLLAAGAVNNLTYHVCTCTYHQKCNMSDSSVKRNIHTLNSVWMLVFKIFDYLQAKSFFLPTCTMYELKAKFQKIDDRRQGLKPCSWARQFFFS